MDDIISQYQRGSNKELEIRVLNIEKDQWIQLYKNQKTKSVTTKVITIINRANGNIKYSYYKNTKTLQQDQIAFINKKKLSQTILYSKYKLVLSDEKPINGFPVKSTDDLLIRLKIRESFTYKQWSLDFTLVKTLNTIIDKNIIVDYFKYYDNILDFINDSKDELQYEVEMEYKGYTKNITNNDILDVIGFINNQPLCIEFITNMFEKLIKPIPLTKEIYDDIFRNQNDYIVSSKIDGSSYIIYINDKETIAWKKGANLKYKMITYNNKPITSVNIGDIIFQGEYVDDNTIYIVDIFKYGNIDCLKLPFIDRYSYADHISKLSKEIFKVKDQYILTDNLDKLDILDKLPLQDGIIFNKNVNYFDMLTYKWKDKKDLSIDFIIINPAIYDEKLKHEQLVYHLYTSVTRQQLVTYSFDFLPYWKDDNQPYPSIQFMPFLNKNDYIWKPLEKKYILKETNEEYNYDKLHMLVGEFILKDSKWELINLRDRKFGNNFNIANTLYTQYYDEFTLNYLKNPIEEGYFQKQKEDKYKEQTKYFSFVRENLYKQLKGRSKILVLAAGKGQEVYLAQHLNASDIVFCDIDMKALSTLIQRLYYLSKPTFYSNKQVPQSFGKNYVLALDLRENYKSNITKITTQTNINKFDAIVINLALPYIVDSQKQLENFVNFIDNLLNDYGIFVFTGYDGENLFSLLNTKKEYKVMEENLPPEVIPSIVYHIVADFPKNATKLTYDCKIKVVLPFTDKYYEENLLNFTSIIEEFNKRNYELRQYGPVTNFIDYYNKKLSPRDIEYLGFYYYASVWKNKK